MRTTEFMPQTITNDHHLWLTTPCVPKWTLHWHGRCQTRSLTTCCRRLKARYWTSRRTFGTVLHRASGAVSYCDPWVRNARSLQDRVDSEDRGPHPFSGWRVNMRRSTLTAYTELFTALRVSHELRDEIRCCPVPPARAQPVPMPALRNSRLVIRPP
jgi:hypothetical protein